MTAITIAYEVSDDKIKEIESLLRHEEIYNVNFNGENFTIERGDFTCIADREDMEYIELYNKIENIISGWN